MTTKFFSPSTNIIRDKDLDLLYIPTENGERAFNKIVSSYETGAKTFSIIGNYGTGKSTFILALERVLNYKANFYPNLLSSSTKRFETAFIVGEYNSFRDSLCEALDLKHKDILDGLSQKLDSLKKKDKGLLLVIDEFGKFLEFAAKENPDEELYLIQQLAEYANNPKNDVIFITTLHQTFDNYGVNLSASQKKEWDKVNGRFIEVSFNEPVEHLLQLAGDRLVKKNIKCNILLKDRSRLLTELLDSGAFPQKSLFTEKFANKLFPFDILSAQILVSFFKAGGQNERSLFTFLESDDYLGLTDYVEGNRYFSLTSVYDYLTYNFYSVISSRINPLAPQWRAITTAIERAEVTLKSNIEEAVALIKVIGLIAVFGKKGQRVTKKFLSTYGNVALGIENIENAIKELEKKQIIRYREFGHKYILFEGTDMDMDSEMQLAEASVSNEFSLLTELEKHFNLPILSAKRSYFEKGTPRYFEFRLSETPITQDPEDNLDGFVNIIINEYLDEHKVKKESKNKKPIVYGYYKATKELHETVFEIKKLEFVKQKCGDDKVALAEIEEQLRDLKEKLNDIFIDSLFGSESNISWFLNGKNKPIHSSRQLNAQLSELCDTCYSETPIFLNELVNREKISGTISSSKNKLVELLLNKVEEEDLGFETDKFPSEKSIYLSLIKNNGMHRRIDDQWVLCKPDTPSFQRLWIYSEEFLDECIASPRKVSDFMEHLKQRPFKLKSGFIEFWVPIFLIAKKSEYALYAGDRFLDEVLKGEYELLMKNPSSYKISSFKLSDEKLNLFNKYRNFLQLIESGNPTKDTFIETIKPFMSFYRGLNNYAKQTKNISSEALRLREALSRADKPEQVFFVDIPGALRYSSTDLQDDKKMEKFTVTLHSTTRELSATFSNLINRLEEAINSTISSRNLSFPENKQMLQDRFKKVDELKLKTKLKVILQRINTPLEDRQSWLSSVANAIIGKTPDNFTDDDEKAFKSLFAKYVAELDNISEISSNEINTEEEEILKVELTSLVEGVQKQLIRMPKGKSKEVINKSKELQNSLKGNDKQTNIAILLKLLQEEMGNG